ncbi:MAG TPA: hypothetical protein VFJ07_03770 [Streptosporangiaceae bacterium]|nr:hypothetical protein [Streptosporangiaceae bacterium]
MILWCPLSLIGTNSQNGSFEVWSWNGSVAANGDPVVNGSDGKVWIMDGGPDSGWSQVGVNAIDMGLSPCSPAGQASVGGSAMWFNSTVGGRGLVFSDGGGLFGPYTTLNSGPIVAQQDPAGLATRS